MKHSLVDGLNQRRADRDQCHTVREIGPDAQRSTQAARFATDREPQTVGAVVVEDFPGDHDDLSLLLRDADCIHILTHGSVSH